MFELHPQLAADTVPIVTWPLSEVLLINDANYPWLLLVPARDNLRDFDDLAPDDLRRASEETVRASKALKTAFAPDKINVGALGNMVPQLHIHVIARFIDDAAWPQPIWGVVPAQPYKADALEARLAVLRDAFGES
ncbi:MAG: HIT family protein [Alphaproteobacteria bacterium]|nr:HIT family protein [Alphaproteobacteria bacterium]